MAKKKDYSYMIGQRYGQLVVKDVVRLNVKDGLRIFCVCDCDCGRTGVLIRKSNISKGNSTSCGCTKIKSAEDIIRDHSYIVGQRFGKLTVTGIEVGTDYEGYKTPFCICKCDCGTEGVVLRKFELTTGHTKSCGCSKKYHVPWKLSYHGNSGERIYRIWSKMVDRCLNPHDNAFQNYGGRGITICDDWLGDNGFLNFKKWSYANGYTDDLTIDRVDNDKGYSPDNCRWADIRTQSYNKRVRRDNKSGVRGVHKRNHRARWMASVVSDGTSYYVGDFDSLEEAAAARNKFIRENGLPNQPSYVPGTKEEY